MKRKKPADDRRISEMKSLGPACERDLNAAGIFTADDLKAVGAETAFLKMLEEKKRVGRSAKCCNAAYLYALYAAIHDMDWRNIPEKKKRQFKAFTADLRESGKFR